MISYTVAFLVLVFSVISDLKISKIRNILVLPAILAGMSINLVMEGFLGLMQSVGGILLPILLLGIFFMAKQLGAGDIKLFSSIGAFLGWKFVIFTIIYSFILAGVICFIKLFMSKNTKSTFKSFFTDVKLCFLTKNISHMKRLNERITVKLSPAIAAAFILQVLQIHLVSG